MINLSKTPKINLTKGQSINLTKDGTPNTMKLPHVYFGAKWGSIIKESKSFLGIPICKSRVKSVDLDTSLLLYGKYGLIETIYFGNKYSKDGSIKHSGDDVKGSIKEEDVDNETISINLDCIDSKVKCIVAIINSFSHHKFDEIPYIKLRIYNGDLGNPEEILCSYNIANDESFKGKEAMILGYFYRTEDDWKFCAVGTATEERSIKDIAHGSATKLIFNLEHKR